MATRVTPPGYPPVRVRGKLRHVAVENFGRTEYTMWNRLAKRVRDNIQEGEVVCFVAGLGNQLAFVWKPVEVGQYKTRAGKTVAREICVSSRMRLTSRGWNPLMLANYARKVGIELEGLTLFEDHYPELQAMAA